MAIEALTYLRVSGRGQITGDGFPRQRETIKRYAAANNITLVAEYRDEGVSGTKELDDRDGLGDLMVRTKQNASFWLGLIAFDRGEFHVAVDYFDQRVLSAFPDSIWTSAARYNLGRSYEAQARQNGQAELWEKAVGVYHSVQDSPWTAACRWRAAAIEQDQLKTPPSEE